MDKNNNFNENLNNCEKDIRVIIGSHGNNLHEYSITKKSLIHDFGKFSSTIQSVAISPGKKSFFVSEADKLHQYDICTRKQVFTRKNDGMDKIVLTYDCEYIIAVVDLNLEFWAVKQKNLITWENELGQPICSIACTYDNKYLFVGYTKGLLSIVDIQTAETIKNCKALRNIIYSIAFTKNNRTAYISDGDGYIRMMKWKQNANTEEDFELLKFKKSELLKIGNKYTYNICLTNDEENLIIGSGSIGKVYILNLYSEEVIKEFNLTTIILKISQVDEEMFAVVAEYNSDLTIIDLESFDIVDYQPNVTGRNSLTSLAVI